MTLDEELASLAQYLSGEPSAVAVVDRARAELGEMASAQASCEMAVSRAIDEVDDAFAWLEKFVGIAGGETVCGEHVTAIGGGEGNNPWANALEVLSGAVAERDRMRALLAELCAWQKSKEGVTHRNIQSIVSDARKFIAEGLKKQAA